jgi:hypothetical protein
VVVALGGCLQTAPVVVVTPQDQAARLLYNCPNGKTLDVTRVQGNTAALVVVDGKTLRLPRDGAMTTAERYSNRLQTLTLYGSSAAFESLGHANYSPCMAGASTPPLGAGSSESTPAPVRRGSDSE